VSKYDVVLVKKQDRLLGDIDIQLRINKST